MNVRHGRFRIKKGSPRYQNVLGTGVWQGALAAGIAGQRQQALTPIPTCAKQAGLGRSFTFNAGTQFS